MADTTDELIVVVEDELITAETTNKNNKYLETLMTDYAGELRQYLDNQLQTLENEFQGDLTNLETTLQGSIDELEAKVDSISFAPDYDRAISVNLPYTVTSDGWFSAQVSSYNGASANLYVNGQQVGWATGVGDARYGGGSWAVVPVSTGDSVTGNQVGNAKFIPIKGGN